MYLHLCQIPFLSLPLLYLNGGASWSVVLRWFLPIKREFLLATVCSVESGSWFL